MKRWQINFLEPSVLGLTIFNVLIWQGFYSNFTVSSRSFLFQALHLNTEGINLVHGLFVPSKQEAGAYIYRRDWWDFLPNKWDRKGGKY